MTRKLNGVRWVLTIRKIRIASGDLAGAERAAAYVVDAAESPRQFTAGGNGNAMHAAWLGSARLLGALGVAPAAEVARDQLALALQGCNAHTGERVRREGMIQRLAYDARGVSYKTRVKGTKSVDLTFSAPKSVSVVWSQATPELRAEIEPAMLAAADAMLEWMTLTKPVVAWRRTLLPACGFAAAAALHVTARTARGEPAPSPQLHVHGVVVGVERDDGLFASPELSGMFKHGAPLEGGAIGRLKLAEALVELGFAVDGGLGREQRFFEIRSVPAGLIARMSARTKDVVAQVTEREAQRSTPLTNVERAIAAFQTRGPKRKDLSPERIAAIWRADAEEFGFGSDAVEALRGGRGFAGDLTSRRSEARGSALGRLAARGSRVSPGEARAIVFEASAGRLRLSEARALLDEMARSGELPGAAPGPANGLSLETEL